MPPLAYAVIADRDEPKTQSRRGITQGVIHEDDPCTAYTDKGNIKWQVGRQLPIKARRTGNALGYIEVTDLRTQDVRGISFDDAVAEQTARLYPAEQFHCDPIVSFLYTWVKLNVKSLPLKRELLTTIWEAELPMLDRKQMFIQRLNEMPADLFMAHVIVFRYVPGTATLAGHVFVTEYEAQNPK